jgi:sarcosine oxidase gamma subunit
LPNAGVQVQAEGRFVIPRIYPGQYELVASTATGTGAGEPRGFATLDLNVNGQDLSNLVIRLQPGSTVSGRVAFDGTSAPPAASDVTVRLTPVGASVAPDSGVSTAVQADGTFALRDVPPGRYRVAATVGGAANWTLQSAVVAGIESLDAPVDIRVGQSIDDGVVRFTDVRTQLRGAILDGAGRRVSGYSLVAFSTDARLWQTSARRVHHRKAATDGTYSFDLTPGEYFLAAAGELTDEQAADVAILEALAGAAIRVTVAAGEQKTLDVRMGQ